MLVDYYAALAVAGVPLVIRPGFSEARTSASGRPDEENPPANAQSRLSGSPSCVLAYINCKAGGGRGVGRIAPPSSSALCLTPGPAGLLGASLWRDALCPNTSTAARRAVEGKGGAAWRRDRTRAQPRTGPVSGRAWRARGGPIPCPQRAPWHSARRQQRELSTGGSRAYARRILGF